MRLQPICALVAALTLGPLASSAYAASRVEAVASLSAETPISAGDGWLVWSVPVSGGWGLQALHAGKVETLPVASRPQPFDASVGTDAHDAPVLTFSRCTRTPRMRDVGIAEGGGSLLQPDTGEGCRIYLLELADGRERRLAIPYPPGASDTTPSMWHGSVAFARKAPGHGDVWQVMAWSSSHPRVVRTLRHGAIPTKCGPVRGGCGAQPDHGEVESLDRDGALVTFLWAEEGPGVLGEGAWELRVDDLANGRSSLAAVGIGHEACTGPQEGLEYVWPETPVADGRRVLFSTLEGYSCFKSFSSELGEYRVGGGRMVSGVLLDTVLEIAQDGEVTYGVVAPPAANGEDSPRCSVAAPCVLEQITPPTTLRARASVPTPPFFEG
jgi:hypothetical protein